MSRVTIKDRIITELEESPFALDYATLSSNTGDNEPSIRRAMRELQIEGRVRIANYGDGTPYNRRTWVLTGEPVPASSDPSKFTAVFVQ